MRQITRTSTFPLREMKVFLWACRFFVHLLDVAYGQLSVTPRPITTRMKEYLTRIKSTRGLESKLLVLYFKWRLKSSYSLLESESTSCDSSPRSDSSLKTYTVFTFVYRCVWSVYKWSQVRYPALVITQTLTSELQIPILFPPKLSECVWEQIKFLFSIYED